MATLNNKSKNKLLIRDLRIADSTWSRMKGLLGTKTLPSDQGLWIHRCNSIHTFFMAYAIDCIFVNKKMKVVSLVPNVVPYRMLIPRWGADSVVELAAGELQKMDLNLGDELYVGN